MKTESIKKARQIVEEAAGVDERLEASIEVISELEIQMEESARNLNFEQAIKLRDQIKSLQAQLGLAGASAVRVSKKRKVS